MTLADETLALGVDLLRLSGSPSRPRQIALRKAVHCAYYAAFIALCEEWARTFHVAARPTASRMLDHGVVKTACGQIAKGTFKGGAICPSDLVACARALPELLDARFDADYDSTARFKTGQVRLLLREAEFVIESLRTARATNRPELHLFLLQCAGAKR